MTFSASSFSSNSTPHWSSDQSALEWLWVELLLQLLFQEVFWLLVWLQALLDLVQLLDEERGLLLSPTDLENLWKEASFFSWLERDSFTSSFTFLCIFYRIEHPLLSLFFEPPSFINFLWQINSSTVSSALICYSNYFFQSSPVSRPKKGFHERKSTIWQSLSYVPKYIIVFWIQRC